MYSLAEEMVNQQKVENLYPVARAGREVVREGLLEDGALEAKV